MYHIYSSSIFVLSVHFPLVFYLLVVHLKRLNIRVKLTFYLMFIAQLTFYLTFVAREVGGGGEGNQDFNRQGWSNGGKSQNPKTSLGLQTKRKRKSHAEFPNHKNFQKAETVAEQVWFYFIRRTTRPGVRRNYHDLQIVLNTPKESLLNQVTPKNACQNFPTPKKSPNGKFETPQKSFDHPCHLKSGVPPLEFIPSLSLSIHRSDRVWIEFYTGFTKTSEMFSWEGDTRLVLAEQGVVTVKPGQAFPSLTN